MRNLFLLDPEDVYDMVASGELTIQEFLVWVDFREASVFGLALGEPDQSRLN